VQDHGFGDEVRCRIPGEDPQPKSSGARASEVRARREGARKKEAGETSQEVEEEDEEEALMGRSRKNPATNNKPTDTELVVGGVASVALVGLGVYLVYSAVNPPGQSPDTTSTLEDTSSLAAIALMV
jgi:hypothetical protein